MSNRLVPLVLLACLSISCSDDTTKADVGNVPPRDSAADAPAPDRSGDRGPIADAATVTILGPSGGLATSADGQLELDAPAGAIPESTAITIELVHNVPAGAVGDVGYDIGPTGMVFNKGVTIRLSYDRNTLGGITEASTVQSLLQVSLPPLKP